MFYALPNTALYLSLFLQIEVLFRYTTALLAWLCLLLFGDFHHNINFLKKVFIMSNSVNGTVKWFNEEKGFGSYT